MTFEADFYATLKQDAARVFPDFAPVGTQRPYVTYQSVGGQVINPLDGADPGKRNCEMQVNVWADTRKESLAVSRAIETRLRAASLFIARPIGAASADFDPLIPVYGSKQDFSVWFTG